MSKVAAIKETTVPEKMPVISAQLQAAVRLPGGRTEMDLSPVKLPGAKMLWIRGEGLLVQFQDKEGFIPSTNVKMVHFE